MAVVKSSREPPNVLAKKISADNVRTAVFSAIDRLKEVLPPATQLDADRSALLLADGTSLDSMAVVNLLVFIEEEMFSKFGAEITLAGAEDDASIEPEELETIGTLIDAISARVT